ncbi:MULTISPECIES: transposase [unclassified Microcoleus]|uniref:transposase n=1 Tax=unclassified Microcoleus TaxID=2642155 RepID=UPI002FD168C7
MGARLRVFLSQEQDKTLLKLRTTDVPRHEVQQLWSKWESQGLYILFLPKYCSEMNPIELEWQHLKKDELAATFV